MSYARELLTIIEACKTALVAMRMLMTLNVERKQQLKIRVKTLEYDVLCPCYAKTPSPFHHGNQGTINIMY